VIIPPAFLLDMTKALSFYITYMTAAIARETFNFSKLAKKGVNTVILQQKFSIWYTDLDIDR